MCAHCTKNPGIFSDFSVVNPIEITYYRGCAGEAPDLWGDYTSIARPKQEPAQHIAQPNMLKIAASAIVGLAVMWL